MNNCSNNQPPYPQDTPHVYSSSTQGIKRVRDDSPQKENSDIKCRRISITEDTEEARSFISFPEDILISIIQKNTLFELQGLFLSCKMFSSLILKNIRTIVLQNKKELPHLPTILEKAVSQSNQSLVNLAIWTSCSQPGLVNDETFNSIRHFPNITKLILGRTQDLCNVSSTGFLHLTALKKLELLELHYLKIDASSVNKVISSLSNLTSLRLRGITRGVNAENNDKLISSLATTSLQRLGLWTDDSITIPDSEFTILSRQTGLTELILGNCRRTDSDRFKDIAQLVHLKHLGLFFRDNLTTHKEIEKLDTLTNLNTLHLKGIHSLNPAFSTSLLKLKTVTQLSIDRPLAMEESFVSRIQHMNLKTLRFSSIFFMPHQNFAHLCSLSTLESLDLDNIPFVNNEALESISNHSNLSKLTLSSLSNINDLGIKSLEKMLKLTTLNVIHCPHVTKNAIDTFYASRLKPSKEID